MTTIQDSLQAIQEYNPKAHVYLRVVGEGSNQYLKAEKIGWFGRILMWFGCSSANISKIARFVHLNIDKLCSSTLIDLKDNDNALGKLAFRLNKYNKQHPKNIEFLVEKINDVYARVRFSFLKTTAIVYNKPAFIHPQMNTPVSVTLAPVLTSPPTTSQSQLLNPIPSPSNSPKLTHFVIGTPIAALPNTLSQTNGSTAIQEALKEFRENRLSIANAAYYLFKGGDKYSPCPPQNFFSYAETDLNKIKALIAKSYKFPDVLQALVSEITLDEITDFSKFATSTPPT